MARSAHEAPLRVAAAAVLVRAEEAVGELHEPAEPAVEVGALADADDAGELLDGADEDEDGGGEEVGAVAEDGVDVLRELAEDRVVDFELRGARDELRHRMGGRVCVWLTMGPVYRITAITSSLQSSAFCVSSSCRQSSTFRITLPCVRFSGLHASPCATILHSALGHVVSW